LLLEMPKDQTESVNSQARCLSVESTREVYAPLSNYRSDPSKQRSGWRLPTGRSVRPTAMAGVSERSIMIQTGHRPVQLMRRYIRDGNLFRENSAGKLGL
jgi:hypothetical protein